MAMIDFNDNPNDCLASSSSYYPTFIKERYLENENQLIFSLARIEADRVLEQSELLASELTK